ncbi:transposase [Streptomyces griseofuscus]|uniref:transposase n=1 Tax=Streptomyces griseofuscus TaxID=146922 RepID=UPI00382E369B
MLATRVRREINGRKRHLLTDTLGLLLAVQVTPASVTDRDGATALLPPATGRFRRLTRIWADGGYIDPLSEWTSRHLGLVLDIVPPQRGRQRLPGTAPSLGRLRLATAQSAPGPRLRTDAPAPAKPPSGGR